MLKKRNGLHQNVGCSVFSIQARQKLVASMAEFSLFSPKQLRKNRPLATKAHGR